MDFSLFSDAILTLASTILTACVPVAIMKVNSLFKLNLDQSHRASVTSAVQTALAVGFQAVDNGGISNLVNPVTRTAAVNAIVSYVKQAASEAVSQLNLSDEVIAKTVSSHVTTMLDVASPSNKTG